MCQLNSDANFHMHISSPCLVSPFLNHPKIGYFSLLDSFSQESTCSDDQVAI